MTTYRSRRPHVVASELLGTVALAAARGGARVGSGGCSSQPPATAAVLAVGIAGAAYATVLVYTGLPRPWAAWSGG